MVIIGDARATGSAAEGSDDKPKGSHKAGKVRSRSEGPVRADEKILGGAQEADTRRLSTSRFHRPGTVVDLALVAGLGFDHTSR